MEIFLFISIFLSQQQNHPFQVFLVSKTYTLYFILYTLYMKKEKNYIKAWKGGGLRDMSDKNVSFFWTAPLREDAQKCFL